MYSISNSSLTVNELLETLNRLASVPVYTLLLPEALLIAFISKFLQSFHDISLSFVEKRLNSYIGLSFMEVKNHDSISREAPRQVSCL